MREEEWERGKEEQKEECWKEQVEELRVRTKRWYKREVEGKNVMKTKGREMKEGMQRKEIKQSTV